MSVLRQIVGAVMVFYAAGYTLQAVFNDFYAGLIAIDDIWRVMNYLSGFFILIAIAVAWQHQRSVGGGREAVGWWAAKAGFIATLVLGIWFFSTWFNQLMVGPGQTDDFLVVWRFVVPMLPITLGAAGLCLWNSARRAP